MSFDLSPASGCPPYIQSHSPLRIAKRISVLPWLVRGACRAGTIDFCPVLAALVGPVQKHFFPHCILFQFICPHCPESWAGSRAGPPVS
jgi:hypothetical protein